jgi:DnaJ-class molecular chaperone
MASRNHYVVLGVASNETEQGVRAAFREKAKRYHPDRVGPAGATPFREIVQAYETLGDPKRRSDYDESLRRSSGALVREVSLRRDLADARPSEDALFGRLERNFTGVGAPRGEGVEELRVDVAISQEEARRGTRVLLGVPVFARCPRCAGRGCVACAGHGTVEGERPVAVDVPPMSGGGTTFVVPLSSLGIRNFYLAVRVRVDAQVEPQAR